MKKNIECIQELEQALLENEIAIYGAGYVAERFYKTLQERKLDVNVKYFVTTNGGGQSFCELPIISINQLQDGERMLICLAVHEAIKDEIIELLHEKNITNYVWIYPFQYDLLLGEPIYRNVKIPIADLVKRGCEDYRLAIRYLAIEQYYGKNEIGYDMYVRGTALSCNYNTAQARLDKFVTLIKSWKVMGYDETKPICILENKDIIDGTHRLLVAIYEQQEFIVCNIYGRPTNGCGVHNEVGKLTKESVYKANFTIEEITLLERINQKILGQYLKY